MPEQNLSTSSSSGRRGFFVVLAKLIVFVAVVCVLFFVALPSQFTYDYTASIIDKMSRLDSLDSPKVIILGDSNVAFGFRSDAIEQTLGMPVVNMGVHKGTGNYFNDNAAHMNVGKGDIVVLCDTDYTDEDEPTSGEAVQMWEMMENHLPLWKMMRGRDFVTMRDSFPIYLNEVRERIYQGTGNAHHKDTAYARESFNEYGDNVYSKGVEYGFYFTTEQIGVPEPITDEAAARINRLNKYVKRHGGTLLIAAFPVPVNDNTPPEELYDEFWSDFASKVEAPVVTDFRDYFFDYLKFFDDARHLGDDGAYERSYKLAEDIQEYMSNR